MRTEWIWCGGDGSLSHLSASDETEMKRRAHLVEVVPMKLTVSNFERPFAAQCTEKLDLQAPAPHVQQPIRKHSYDSKEFDLTFWFELDCKQRERRPPFRVSILQMSSCGSHAPGSKYDGQGFADGLRRF